MHIDIKCEYHIVLLFFKGLSVLYREKETLLFLFLSPVILQMKR